jgi:hypothetical protein
MQPRMILALLALALFVEAPSEAMEPPHPPRLPREFRWEGRYIVRDLGVDVPFTWQGTNGNLQMIAGGPAHPIHFTNVLFDGWLYTLTYKWPDTVEPPPASKCVCIGRLNLDALNACLVAARYVGAEILKGRPPRPVHHFRVSVVLGEPEAKPNPFRLPMMQGDFYVHWSDSSKFWQVLHYGLQNLLDPALDEWIIMHTFSDASGEVTLPAECPATCRSDAFALPLFCR